jgi:hypothetical protein
MRRFLVGVLVSGVIVAHVGWSSHVSLDWPTIALVGIVVAVVFAPETALTCFCDHHLIVLPVSSPIWVHLA